MSKLIYFIVPIGIILSGIVLTNCQKSSGANDLRFVSEHLRVVSAEPPPGITLGDDPVPLENFDVRERFDRELQRYVYFHSSTIILIKRSARYKQIFKRILKKNNIPEDFFYLAIAESALSNAISPAGAKGFWQFLSATAKEYGLEVSETVDERYHPEKSTEAACKYFNDAHKRFDDWALVAASYNMGQAGVVRALEKQQVDNYYDLHLNRETSKYVFRILAYKSILEDPASFGYNVKEKHLYKPVPYFVVQATEDIPDLAQFAKDNGSTYRMLKVMNPWLISDHLTVKEGKVYEIRFPHTTNIYVDELLIDGKSDSLPPKEKEEE